MSQLDRLLRLITIYIRPSKFTIFRIQCYVSYMYAYDIYGNSTFLQKMLNKHMCSTSKVNLTKRFSKKYKRVHLITRLYGIAIGKYTK